MKYQVTVQETGQAFACSEDQHLLQGMQASQVGMQLVAAIPVGCRGGGCGICRIRVLSGDYDVKKMSRKHVSSEQQDTGIALACRVYPRSELSIAVAL